MPSEIQAKTMPTPPKEHPWLRHDPDARRMNIFNQVLSSDKLGNSFLIQSMVYNQNNRSKAHKVEYQHVSCRVYTHKACKTSSPYIAWRTSLAWESVSGESLQGNMSGKTDQFFRVAVLPFDSSKAAIWLTTSGIKSDLRYSLHIPAKNHFQPSRFMGLTANHQSCQYPLALEGTDISLLLNQFHPL